MREFLRLPDYFLLVGYVDSGGMVLRFGRERMIVNSDIFDLTYETIRLCLPRGADPEERGYYYFVCRRKPEAGEIISRPPDPTSERSHRPRTVSVLSRGS